MKLKSLSLLLGVLLVAVMSSGCGYNTLQSKQQGVKASWAEVENQLQRRSDLIPNLFEAAKAAGVQEQEVFGQIAAARSQLLNAKNASPEGEGGDKSPAQKQAVLDANSSLGSALGRLLVITENYPNLKSNENFLKFQDELAGTENRIATARNRYNTGVQDYNTTRGNFPTVISAKIFGFQEEPYFKADETAKQGPPVIKANDLRNNQKK